MKAAEAGHRVLNCREAAMAAGAAERGRTT